MNLSQFVGTLEAIAPTVYAESPFRIV